MKSSIRRNNLDFSIKPGNDFYNFVNKKYIEKTKIPNDQVSVGAFYDISKNIQKEIRKICEENEKEKFGFLYKYSMNKDKDFLKYNKEEVKKYLNQFLEPIEKTKNLEELTNLIINFSEKIDLFFLFSLSIEPNPLNPDELILDFFQSGLTLPDESYYTSDSFKEIVEEYKKYLQNAFKITKMKGNYLDLFEFEKQIAKFHLNLNELRDVEKTTNLKSVDYLFKTVKNIDIKKYLQVNELGNYKRQINISTLTYFKNLDKIWNTDNFEKIKMDIVFSLKSKLYSITSPTLRKLNFNFFDKFLAGQKKKAPRWKRSIGVASVLGWQIAKKYVDKFYTKEHDKKINELVDNLTKSYKISIQNSKWLGEKTKKQALFKLEKIDRKIGHPKIFRDYSNLKIDGKSVLEITDNIKKYQYKKTLEKLDKKVDRSLWYMYPQTVNAYYNPQANEIVFPAAILQPPFFDPFRDEAENYGSIGTIIGHEIGHAFDDQGAKFDFYGKKDNWWTKDDEEEFRKLGDKLVKYFDKKKVDKSDKIGVDGKRTLGENIGDLAGLSISLKAYKMTKSYKDNKVINGFTPLQRFFISYALSWKTKSTKEYQELLLANDVHSPVELRTNLIVALIDDFYDAFDVSQNDKLYVKKNDRITIW